MRYRVAAACLLITSVLILPAAEEPHGHVAVHGGCLNEIGGCENGHAEAKVEGRRLRLWLVGGGSNTAAAMRVPEATITLSFKEAPGRPAATLVLTAKPLLLAEEKVGDCSYFEADADWLEGIKDFAATGAVTFKGKKADLIIAWPHGYDPDHDEPAPAAGTPAGK